VRGFKAFLLRGNVVELATAVVIGVAFGVVITAFVKDLVTPLIAAIGGQPDFSSMSFTVNNSKFLYGDFLNAFLAFVLIAAVIYFLVIVPYTAMMARSKKDPADPATRQCPECLSEIPIDAHRCAFCGERVAPPVGEVTSR
jgi:large conductance mechanosensitive channel